MSVGQYDVLLPHWWAWAAAETAPPSIIARASSIAAGLGQKAAAMRSYIDQLDISVRGTPQKPDGPLAGNGDFGFVIGGKDTV